MLQVGEEHRAWSWSSASTSHGFQPCSIAKEASAIAAAVARDNQRSTLTGEACRSAMAPKKSGETKAATAEAAKAKGLMARSPWASSTVLKGTSHIPIAAP